MDIDKDGKLKTVKRYPKNSIVDMNICRFDSRLIQIYADETAYRVDTLASIIHMQKDVVITITVEEK